MALARSNGRLLLASASPRRREQYEVFYQEADEMAAMITGAIKSTYSEL